MAEIVLVKKCSKCKMRKTYENFYKDRTKSRGLSSQCRLCVKEKSATYRSKPENRSRISSYMADRYESDRQQRMYEDIRKKYGLSRSSYDAMFDQQCGLCWICGFKLSKTRGRLHERDKSPHIDHDHKTGKVRGILCGLCNRGLGQFKDNPDFLIKAAEYLKECG